MKRIYAYIGVIGSGKDYQARKHGAPIFDFSDGVREFTFSFLGIDKKLVDREYALFKSSENFINIVDIYEPFETREVTGREFLENVGTKMRQYDPDFWAKYCVSKAEKLIIEESPDLIVFNAVRYPNEASKIIELWEKYDYELTFIFCNYKSDRYEIRDHESEFFAQTILKMGAQHLEVVNLFVDYIVNNEGV